MNKSFQEKQIWERLPQMHQEQHSPIKRKGSHQLEKKMTINGKIKNVIKKFLKEINLGCSLIIQLHSYIYG